LGKDLMFVEAAHPDLAGRKTANTQPLLYDETDQNKDTSKSGASVRVSAPSGEPEGAVYSRQLMCEDTGISYEEPSPNSFSFNSPYGACPTCKGLGQVYTVNMDAIIPDRNKTINEGGIAPLGGEREAYIFRQVQTLSKKENSVLINLLKNCLKGF
ncbi:MAG TPA: hypothetical protein VNA26_02925, partial [Chitinophagaceae bacterium]|nr:hypothetical protein [Chitinophagaceae bacterium]